MLIKNLIDAANWRFPISAKAFVEGAKMDMRVYILIIITRARGMRLGFLYM